MTSAPRRLKPGPTPKSIALWFAIVLGLYLGIFYAVEYWNHRQGPWEVTFLTDQAGKPSIAISQPKLNISAVRIDFNGEKISTTKLSEKVQFAEPSPTLPFPTPFGQVIYQDLRALPGVVTFNFFGHEVELLPRVLVVNKKELPWRSGTTLELSPADKPSSPPKPPKGWEDKQ
jgi:hypothetical protein